MNEYTDDIIRGLERVSTARVPRWMHAVARIGNMTVDDDAHWQHYFEAPFDAHLRDLMTDACRELKAMYPDMGRCHVYRDEITLQVGRKQLSKECVHVIASILASQVSIGLSLKLGKPVAFRCSMTLLPTENLVDDYFDNLLNLTKDRTIDIYSDWLLRMTGHKSREASSLLRTMTREQELHLMAVHGYGFDKLPDWQRTGVVVD